MTIFNFVIIIATVWAVNMFRIRIFQWFLPNPIDKWFFIIGIWRLIPIAIFVLVFLVSSVFFITFPNKMMNVYSSFIGISYYTLCLVILSYLVYVIILYLYSASILYYWHLLLTGHLPEITKISILSSFMLSIPCAYLLTILGQTFSWLIAFVPIDSCWLPSILLHLRIAQLWSDSTHLFCSQRVTLLCTVWCILQIMMCLLSVVWLILLYLYISPTYNGHSLFRLGLLCEIQDIKPPLSFTCLCSLSSPITLYFSCAKALHLSLLSYLSQVRLSFA